MHAGPHSSVILEQDLLLFSPKFYTLLEKPLRYIPFKLLILYSFGEAQSGLEEVFSISKSVLVSKYPMYGETVVYKCGKYKL